MTSTDTRIKSARTPAGHMLVRAGAAALLALAAPAVSFLPALTTNIHGSGAAVSFPHGYSAMLVVTIAVTAMACALGGFSPDAPDWWPSRRASRCGRSSGSP